MYIVNSIFYNKTLWNNKKDSYEIYNLINKLINKK